MPPQYSKRVLEAAEAGRSSTRVDMLLKLFVDMVEGRAAWTQQQEPGSATTCCAVSLDSTEPAVHDCLSLTFGQL